MPRNHSPRRVLPFLVAALALPLAATAQSTYKVKVDTLLDGADVKVDYQAYDGLLVVSLKNIGENRGRCEVNFDASPQIPSRKTKFVDPGKTVTTELRADRMWFAVDVRVKCTAANEKKKKDKDADATQATDTTADADAGKGD
jgi:hypothetical protein